MQDPKAIAIAAYNYSLPEERIAAFPLAERDASKLLVWNNGSPQTDTYRNIASHLPANSLLVFNNTKVVEARLLFRKPSGGTIEIFCLEPHEQYPDITTAMRQTGKVWWQCLVGGASKWKRGQVLEKKIETTAGATLLRAAYVEKRTGSFIIELQWDRPDTSFAEILHLAGAIPLPPYIKRSAAKEDAERYQTIYAQHDGSVAAPTAGLHFTPAVFEQLTARSIATAYITLHVGAGTFKPVKTDTIGEHDMHAEFIDVSLAFIQQLLQQGTKPVIAVGTTSLRTLESLYWIGCKIWQQQQQGITDHSGALTLQQWEPYEMSATTDTFTAFQALADWLIRTNQDRLVTRTQLLIVHGYQFRVIKGLITNFHQPASTLLLLVAALAGLRWKDMYQYALDNDFRFLSYGDSSLLIP